jgi:uncharacterized membrane protein
MKSNSKDPQEETRGFWSSGWFFWLLAAGFGLIFVGIIIVALAAAFNGNSGSAGVIIFIGPFPIVFGAGPDATWLILVGFTIAAISVVLFWVMRRKLG